MTEKALYAEEAESALLGSILEDNSCWERVRALCPVGILFTDPAKAVYDAIAKVLGSGGTADLISVKEALGSEGIQRAGGLGYLSGLIERLPEKPNPDTYVAIIREKFRLRRLSELGRDLNLAAINGESQDVIDSIFDKIREVQGLNAVSKDDIVHRSKESLQELEQVREEGVNLHVGIGPLDNLLGGLRRGWLYVIGARTSHGKTTVACNTARFNLDGNRNVRVLFNAFENLEQVAIRVASQRSGIPLKNFMQPHALSASDYEATRKAITELDQFKDRLRIVRGLSIERVRSICDDFKPDIVVWDFLQRFAHRYNLSAHGTLAHEVGRAASELQDMAIDKKCAVLCFSQIRRAPEDYQRAFSTTVQYRPPDISELKESGDIENYADVILMGWWPWRDTMSDKISPNEYKLLVRKNKLGPLGDVSSHLDVETLKLSDWK